MQVNITVAKPSDIPKIWGDVYPHIATALNEDFFHDQESLKKLLIDDKALMFIANVDGSIMGVAVAQIEEGKYSLVNILSLGGKDFRHWKKQMNDALTQYAFFMECKYIVANGVKAWQRLWPDFVPGKICYTKEIF